MTFLVVWGALAVVLGTVFATNARGLVDKLVQGAAQTKVLAGRPGEIHPFMKIFPRLIGAVFIAMGCVALGVGIWNL